MRLTEREGVERMRSMLLQHWKEIVAGWWIVNMMRRKYTHWLAGGECERAREMHLSQVGQSNKNGWKQWMSTWMELLDNISARRRQTTRGGGAMAQ